MSSLEQRANIKFCVLLEKSLSEALEMLKKAYGNDAMKKTTVYEWHKGKVGTRQSDVGGFSDYDSVSHYDFIPAGQTVNKELYLEILNDYEMQSDENDLKNGQQTIGFFHTTLLHHITL
ncbi:hypothetical protein AVEN_70487-1 [Araneus ventricosus]|uniref:Mos1 transposase HTH domain-containing protein n=1 Tax=Araneus ventricosus TaxID=182803 RepID=A0A4Y2H367_ARAVE|nr:hypothetical protein AVEN_70487-1 [Araneus ventricosus]